MHHHKASDFPCIVNAIYRNDIRSVLRYCAVINDCNYFGLQTLQGTTSLLIMSFSIRRPRHFELRRSTPMNLVPVAAGTGSTSPIATHPDLHHKVTGSHEAVCGVTIAGGWQALLTSCNNAVAQASVRLPVHQARLVRRELAAGYRAPVGSSPASNYRPKNVTCGTGTNLSRATA